MPFDAPDEDGLFAIGGNVTDGIMTYVPPRFQDAGDAPWPALINLAGCLEFEGASMRVRNASAGVHAHPGWTFTTIHADIADFDNAWVTVESESRGALQAALDIVRTSPAAGYTRHVLDGAQAQGEARLNLALDLPIAELTRSTVNGEVMLQQNDIALGGSVPALAAATGTITFSESGYAINKAQARALGGLITLYLHWQQDVPARRDTPARLDLQLASHLALQWTWPQGLAGALQGTTTLGTAALKKQAQAATNVLGLTLDANLDTLDLDAWQEQLGGLRDHLNTTAPALPDRWQVRVHMLQLTTPAAQLQASGQRQLPAPSAGQKPGQTVMTLDLAIYDAGGLLQRLGKPGLIEDGAGALHATLQWPGSPLDFSIARTSGQLVLELADGCFVKIDPGAGRLLGILSLQALPRRFAFDFDDIFGAGHAFDRVQASARLDRGLLRTEDLKIKGVSATVAMNGQVDLEHKTQDLHAYILPKLDAGAAALATSP